MTLLVPCAHVRKTCWAALLRSASCRRIDTKSRRAPRKLAKLAKLADERGKLLQAFYANAIPLDLLKAEQDRIGVAEFSPPRSSSWRRRATSTAGRTFSKRPSDSPATATAY